MQPLHGAPSSDPPPKAMKNNQSWSVSPEERRNVINGGFVTLGFPVFEHQADSSMVQRRAYLFWLLSVTRVVLYVELPCKGEGLGMGSFFRCLR